MLRKWGEKEIVDFVSRNYRTEEMVFASVGSTSVKKMKRVCEKFLGGLKAERSSQSLSTQATSAISIYSRNKIRIRCITFSEG